VETQFHLKSIGGSIYCIPQESFIGESQSSSQGIYLLKTES